MTQLLKLYISPLSSQVDFDCFLLSGSNIEGSHINSVDVYNDEGHFPEEAL